MYIFLSYQYTTYSRLFLLSNKKYGKFHVKSSRSLTTPSDFFLLWTYVRYNKVRKKAVNLDPGKLGNPIFSSVKKWAQGPKNGHHDMPQQSIIHYEILIFEKKFDRRTVKNGPSMFLRVRNPKSILRKAGEIVFHDFFEQ